MFCKKAVLGNFAKFTGKHLCQSLFFNKVAGLRPATSLKKRLWHRFFPVDFCKIYNNNFSYRTPTVAASRTWSKKEKNTFLLLFPNFLTKLGTTLDILVGRNITIFLSTRKEDSKDNFKEFINDLCESNHSFPIAFANLTIVVIKK